MENKKKILIAVLTVILGIVTALLCYTRTGDVNETLNIVQGTIVDVIEQVSTTEIPELTANAEQTLEVQEVDLENETFEEQGEIAYNGSDEAPKIMTGDYQGLTYFSQIDSRWKNTLYTSVGDKAQTIGSSGCGPTSASMVVSSIRGVVTPEVLAELYVDYGYRSTNNGTYWSAFKWTADVFNIEFKQLYKINDAVGMLKDNNYIIVSCGNGLFTYGGHFIVIVGIEGDTLKIYDPYLYSGKFDTSTRRDKVTVSGNTIYCSVDNFRNYANASSYFCFKNDRTDIIDNTAPVITVHTEQMVFKEYTAKVKVSSSLNIRNGASTSYVRIGSYRNDTIVPIIAESNNWGKTDKGWICLDYVNRIEESSYPGYLIKYGQRNNNVKILQSQLTSAGYNCYGIDGVFGKNTLSSVKNFQRDNGLDVDGIVGPLTWRKLF